MIYRYIYGTPIETDAVPVEIPTQQGVPHYGELHMEQGFEFCYRMEEGDIVYGLGEANRGINKRGYCYVSDCSDDSVHTEDKLSLYAAHNVIIVAGRENFGLFFDYPSYITFDVGYTKTDILKVTCQDADLNLYVIDGESPYNIVKQFRKMIGRSYIPPKFAFGYGQSRLGYKSKEDLYRVVAEYRRHHIPLDIMYMDIEYMQDFKDFTLNEKNFADFPEFVQEMKRQHIRLVPIIDAGVKIEPGYFVYEEGIKGHFFCQKEDGSNFVGNVWPGEVHFPDVLNSKAREWFGEYYRIFIEQGIEGFWNDMNEPSIFHSREGLVEARRFLKEQLEAPELQVWMIQRKLSEISNSHEDYKRFYHQIGDRMIRHDRVHNLYGYFMTRAAGEAFERLEPNKRFLLFSRSSYVGMHRYGGMWTGDNYSWWSHILLNLKMLPSLNMCGFLYVGADLGGFGGNTTRDLLLRWLALGVFTPLMRNHTSSGTREQECYQFENPEDFQHIISVRYRLIPYLYSEYMKAVFSDDMYFKPLAFVYPEDKMARQVEDQLILGNEIMIAPVYTQNAIGRYVYLPEKMKFLKFMPDGSISEKELSAGHHFVEVALNEVPLFIRYGKCIPLAEAAETVEEVNSARLALIGYQGGEYCLYDDDGVYKAYDRPENYKILS